VFAEFRREITDGVHGYPKANMFDQPDLEALLRENLSHCRSVTLRPNSDVTAIYPDGETVLVDFTDRPTGEQHTVTTNYLLGCDGANSIVRAAIGSRMKDLKLEQRWLVVDVATNADLAQWDGVHQVCDPARAATYMRIGATRYRWEFRLLPGESATDFSDLTTLQPLLAPWTGNITSTELELVRVAEYTFRAKLADRWREGNVFLLGDAAHLTPPFIGQGMGAGLRDAMNLAWKLAGVLGGTMPESVLDTYEQERKPHARRMILLALGMGKAMTEGGRFGHLLRRAIAPRLQYIPGLRSTIADGATPSLSRTELVVKSLRPRQLTGTLCPNPDLDGRRFDAIVGGQFAVVTTETPTPSQLHTIEQRGGVIITASAGSDLDRWLRRGHATVAIVRPDRTVMHSGRDLDACSALPGFLLQRKTNR
jgi:3-(3-hydroxy-phenyl)propionate hydroxylase